MRNEADSLCMRGTTARAMGMDRDGNKHRAKQMLEQAEAKMREALSKEQDIEKREGDQIATIKRLATSILDISQRRSKYL